MALAEFLPFFDECGLPYTRAGGSEAPDQAVTAKSRSFIGRKVARGVLGRTCSRRNRCQNLEATSLELFRFVKQSEVHVMVQTKAWTQEGVLIAFVSP